MKKFLLLLFFTSISILATSTRIIDVDLLRSSDQTKTWTPPASTDNLLGRDSTDTVTNKSISGSSNTLTNIPLSTAVTGVLPLANGGTGVDATSVAPSFYNLSVTESSYGNFNVGKELTIFQSTGILSGGALTIDTDTAKFDLAAGEGWIVNSNNLAIPTKTRVTWSAFDAQTVTNLATQDVTYILINSSGAIVQQGTEPTSAQKRANIYIGRLNHFNRTSISFANTLADMLQSPMSQLFDLMDSIGPFNKVGNEITANGANLSMNKAAGTLFVPSYNYTSNNQSPNVVELVGRTAFTFRYATQTTLAGSSVSVIAPASYDNAGTITTVPANGNATIQRVFLFPSNNITVQYGQTVYSNFSEALQAVSRDPFVITPTVKGAGVLSAYVVITKTCASLQNVSCSAIIPASRFGAPSGAVGGTTTLQQAYNNSVAPQITTDATRGAVEIKRGSAADTDFVFKVLNGAGDTKFSVKGNGDTVASGNLFTGPQIVTGSVGISETISALNLSGTNTGDLTSGGDNDTPATTSALVVPNKQLTLTGTNQYRLNTGNFNELNNANFEHSIVSTGWTISNATDSGNTSNPLEGKKSISLSLTGALSLSQSSTINAAQKAGVQMVASVWVSSADVSDLQLCSLKNGAEDKCTVTGGYIQGTGWKQLTVSFLGDSTSNGLKLKSTDTTGTVLVDQAFVGLGSPIVDFTPDMVYSAKISSTGVASDENTDFIQGDCTLSGTANNRKTCTFKTSEFTVSPNCVVVANSPTCESGGCGEYQTPVSVSASQIILAGLKNSDTAYSASSLQLICQKQGADYKTSKAYVASSSDTDWVSCGHTTSDFTGFGTVSNIETQCKREGSDLLMRGKFTSGVPTAVEARVNLKLSGSALTSSSASIPSTQKAGEFAYGTTSASYGTILIEPSVSYTTFGIQSSSNSGLVKQNGNTLVANGVTISFNARIPIQGWTDSGVIVGSFQGYNETPGTSRVETFSVSYGKTATSVCDGTGLVNTNQCAYLDQIGNAVTSVTRSGTGTYSLNTSKTYSKLKCQVGYVPAPSWGSQNVINCSNCNTASFQTVTTTPAVADSYGTLLCQGTY